MERSVRQRQLLLTIWQALSPSNEPDRAESPGGWQLRRFPASPDALLSRLRAEFSPAELQAAGLARSADDGPLILAPSFTGPNVAALPLQDSVGGPPFDLLLPDGLLLGNELPFWALTQDYRIIAHLKTSGGKYLLVPSLEDVLACHRLGLAAAPLPPAAPLTHRLLRSLVGLTPLLAPLLSSSEGATATRPDPEDSLSQMVDVELREEQLVELPNEWQVERQDHEPLEQQVEPQAEGAAWCDVPSDLDVPAAEVSHADSDFADFDFADPRRPVMGPSRLGFLLVSPRAANFPVGGSADPGSADGNAGTANTSTSETGVFPSNDAAQDVEDLDECDDEEQQVELVICGWSFVEARPVRDETFQSFVDELSLAVQHRAADLDFLTIWSPRVDAEERIRYARRLGDRDLEHTALRESLEDHRYDIPRIKGQTPRWEIERTPETLAALHTKLYRMLREPRMHGAALPDVMEKYLNAHERELIQPLLESIAGCDNPLQRLLRPVAAQYATCLHAHAPVVYTGVTRLQLDPFDAERQAYVQFELKLHLQMADQLIKVCREAGR